MREGKQDQISEYLRGYADALNHASFYVADHCLDGEHHAEVIRELRRPIETPDVDMKSYVQRVARSRESAACLLKEAGILDDRGDLAEPYRDRGGIVKQDMELLQEKTLATLGRVVAERWRRLESLGMVQASPDEAEREQQIMAYEQARAALRDAQDALAAELRRLDDNV